MASDLVDLYVHDYERENIGWLIDNQLSKYLPCENVAAGNPCTCVIDEPHTPCVTGTPAFEEITEGRSLRAEKDKQLLSTCGFLVMWLLEILGYDNPEVINRDNVARRTNYATGKNISRIWYGGMRAGIFAAWQSKKDLHRGDIIYISDGSPASEHVEIFLEEDTTKTPLKPGGVVWKMAAAGQLQPKTFRQCACYVYRTFKDGKLYDINHPDGRAVIGSIPIEKLRGKYPVQWRTPKKLYMYGYAQK
jgi:hypothetical protein